MYKLLLCWRYLRTRYIALASIISVMLGVATMNVVNAVMAGFSHEMQKRIHGVLSDVVVESLSLNGFHDPERRMEEIRQAAGEHIDCMTETVTIPSMLSFRYAGQWVTRPVTVVGIPEDKPLAAEYAQYLQHPENRKHPSFRLREGGFDVRDHQAGDDSPTREVLKDSGWPWRRWKAERDRSWPTADGRVDPETGLASPQELNGPSLLEQAAFPNGRPDAAPGALGPADGAAPKDSVAAAQAKVPAPAGFSPPEPVAAPAAAVKSDVGPRIIIGEEEPLLGTADAQPAAVAKGDESLMLPKRLEEPKRPESPEDPDFQPTYSTDGVPVNPARNLQSCGVRDPELVAAEQAREAAQPGYMDFYSYMLPWSIEMDDSEFIPVYSERHVLIGYKVAGGPMTTIGPNLHDQGSAAPPAGVAGNGGAPVQTPADPFRGRPGSAPEFDPRVEQQTGLVLGFALCTFRGHDKKDHFLVLPGDDVKLTMPTAGTPPRAIDDSFTVVDLYESKMNEYDSSFVFVPLKKLQQMRGMIDPSTGIGNVTSIQIKLKDPKDGNLVRDKLREAFAPGVYGVFTWRDKQGPLLAAVQMETAILNVLLFMIIAVAGFGILAIFYMIVVEKTRDIGVLKSLGASGGGVMSIFLSYGLLLGGVGAGVGTGIGLLFVHYINEIADLLSYATGQEVFDPTIYYFYEIPAIIHPGTVCWIAMGAMAIAVAASILPARRAAGLHPVEALRYE